jgi:hypothetical protein
VNVGVVVHARAAEFIALRVLTDVAALRARLPGMDAELLARYLHASEAICAGDAAAGPVALAPPSERFHWLTAPRSDVLQSSPVHEGVSTDLPREVERLYRIYVEADCQLCPGRDSVVLSLRVR